MRKNQDFFFLLIQLATVCVLLGRAWQHWFWDAPFRTVLWEEAWMRQPVSFLLGMTWDEYVSSPRVDNFIQGMIKGFGVFYFVCAVAAIFARKLPEALRWLLPAGSLALMFLAICYMKVSFYSLGQFLEYTLQFSAPVFLFYILKNPGKRSRLILPMKIAIAFTFTCHGLYAVGYYPIPGNFVQMVISILHVGDATAKNFLALAAFMDFLISVLIFLPGRIGRVALLYAVFWGFMTSIARVWANFYPEFWLESLHQWMPETVYRFPHFLIPAALLYFLNKEKSLVFK